MVESWGVKFIFWPEGSPSFHISWAPTEPKKGALMEKKKISGVFSLLLKHICLSHQLLLFYFSFVCKVRDTSAL